MAFETENRKLLLGSVIGAVTIIGLWILSAIIILNVFPEPESHGTFGDLFGAINALFSGLAFLGVIIAIILQKKELEEQRKEIRESRKAQELTASALTKQLELQVLQNKIESLNLLISSISTEITRLSRENTQSSKEKIKDLENERSTLEARLKTLLIED